MPKVVKTKISPARKPANPAKKKKGKTYNMPESIKEGFILTDLMKQQWKIGPLVGSGGFGVIYSACKVGTKNYDYVIKCEPHENGPLFCEMHFYLRNAKPEDIEKFKKKQNLTSLGMPCLYGNGSSDVNGIKHRFIVMPRYSSDVMKYFKQNGNRIPDGTICRLALQMLDVYEYIHSTGYVHADLKADNILLGTGKKGGEQAYLVDFGLATHVPKKEFKPDPKKMHNGTIQYTSRDAHLGIPTIRGDFEILGYNLIEWMGGELPWIKDKLLTAPPKVQKAKEEFMDKIDANLKKLFPKGVSVPVAEFMKYVLQLQYNEVPDYNKCRKMFENALKVMKISNTGDLNFINKSGKANNTTSPNNANKVAGKKQLRDLSITDSSINDIEASDDDDDDVIFEKKDSLAKPRLGPKTLKTISRKPKPKIVSPIRKISPRGSPKKTPLKTTKISPRKISPTVKDNKINTGHSNDTPNGNNSSDLPPASARSSSRATPISAKTNINFSPAISINRSVSRTGKTIINDNITPTRQPSKLYEFNFELDVSMDANVIVNVKRKKPVADKVSSSAKRGSSRSQREASDANEIDTPTTRVKVRKVATDESVASPRTPAVTLKKSKRYVSPR